MAQYPRTIAGLLDYYGVDIAEVYLTCIFCNTLLTLPDILNFDEAELNLVWRLGWPYGCCEACCHKAGLFEFNRHYQFSVPGDAIESFTGHDLLSLNARCFSCLKKLDLATKFVHVWNSFLFHFVHNRWKGCCESCRHAWLSTQHT